MHTQSGVEKFIPVISSEAWHLPAAPASPKLKRRRLAITISRQTGSGAHCVATHLARYLQAHAPEDSCAWTVFDRNLVEQVLEDHHLPPSLGRFMPEDRTPELTDALDELLGLHPPSLTLVQQTAQTILRLANRGNVILIGRAAHIITAQLDYAFHVRLVGSLEKRIAHLQQIRTVGRKEALALIRREDQGRQRYLKKYFGKDIDDPLSYHLVVNTDSMPFETAACLVGEAALEHLHAQRVGHSCSQNGYCRGIP